MSLYEDLGVTEDATPQEIKKAFKSRSLKNHPDKGGNSEDFNRINAAYLVLRDPEKRKRYDETGEVESNTGPTKMEIATQLVAQNLFNVMEVHSFAKRNYFPDMVEAFAAKERSLNMAIDELKRKVVKFTYLKDNTKASELFMTIMENKVHKMHKELEGLDEELTMLMACVEVCRECEYLGEVPAPRPQDRNIRDRSYLHNTDEVYGSPWTGSPWVDPGA
ncbi:chaperone protein [Alteromonas phage vB_AcoS-R7M]|uniref:Chaperone protein n=1 Tax=Alteromonas phage vB_AcoS-R7M TaxID=2729541 RepID=A0A6M3YTH9_9CAUD|nr:chaperone protein [Alteromonas phage vB_AcoS-R7M]QJI53376.1 chaperone protein [Alteromonas phage vB_AcoS-R7M]